MARFLPFQATAAGAADETESTPQDEEEEKKEDPRATTTEKARELPAGLDESLLQTMTQVKREQLL